MCDRLGIDVWEVVDAAKTKPFGFMPFYPGPGLGGHCIPIDPFYLSWKARESGFEARFIELAGHVNGAMPHFVADKVTEALNTRRKSVNGASVLIVGVAYKRDIDDIRESPALDVMGVLRGRGAAGRVHRPIRAAPERAHMGRRRDLASVQITPEALARLRLRRDSDGPQRLRLRRRRGWRRPGGRLAQRGEAPSAPRVPDRRARAGHGGWRTRAGARHRQADGSAVLGVVRSRALRLRGLSARARRVGASGAARAADRRRSPAAGIDRPRGPQRGATAARADREPAGARLPRRAAGDHRRLGWVD